MTADKHRRVALYVAEFGGGSPASRKDLLDALGLLDGTGRGVVPAPKNDRSASLDELTGPATSYTNGERDSGRWQDDKVRPRDLSLVPAGLRDYCPPPEPVPVKPRRRRSKVRGAA